jgi:hypothetical protein
VVAAAEVEDRPTVDGDPRGRACIFAGPAAAGRERVTSRPRPRLLHQRRLERLHPAGTARGSSTASGPSRARLAALAPVAPSPPRVERQACHRQRDRGRAGALTMAPCITCAPPGRDAFLGDKSHPGTHVWWE